MCSQELRELSNPGASGSIFYISTDDEFILKTVQHKEADFLQKLLPEYYMNLVQHTRTLLPKFYGFHCYQVSPSRSILNISKKGSSLFHYHVLYFCDNVVPYFDFIGYAPTRQLAGFVAVSYSCSPSFLFRTGQKDPYFDAFHDQTVKLTEPYIKLKMKYWP